MRKITVKQDRPNNLPPIQWISDNPPRTIKERMFYELCPTLYWERRNMDVCLHEPYFDYLEDENPNNQLESEALKWIIKKRRRPTYDTKEKLYYFIHCNIESAKENNIPMECIIPEVMYNTAYKDGWMTCRSMIHAYRWIVITWEKMSVEQQEECWKWEQPS